MSRKPSFFLNHRVFRWGYALSLLCLLCIALSMVWQGQSLINSDFNDLLPKQDHDIAKKEASDRLYYRLNREVLLLIGADQDQEASLISAAKSLEHDWRETQLFERVQGAYAPDLNKLRQVLKEQILASVPEKHWQYLVQQPEQSIQKSIHDLMTPFGASNVVPIDEDWLRFSQAIQNNLFRSSVVTWNPETNWLSVEAQGKQWVLLSAYLKTDSNMIDAPDELYHLVQTSQAHLAQKGLLSWVASGALFALESKYQGEQEATIMSSLGLGLTLVLLLGLFRTGRVLALLLPVSIGLLAGMIVTVLVFGQIHLFTVIIGTSLLGVLLDFPLHWLAGGLRQKNWQVMQHLDVSAKGFVFSLLVTLLGYLLLCWTSLPILRQTAVFSIVSLVFAFLSNLYLLPCVFRSWQGRQSRLLIWLVQKILNGTARCQDLVRHALFWGLSLLVIAGGLIQLNTQDDIRQWVTLSPKWLNQAEQVTNITKMQPASQYFLVMGTDESQLLAKTEALSQSLVLLQEKGTLASFDSLSQWVQPMPVQLHRGEQLQHLSEQTRLWQPLYQLGLDHERIKAYQDFLVQRTPKTLSESLDNEFATLWKSLYLGQFSVKQTPTFVGMVRLSGIQDISALQALDQPDKGIYFVDQRGSLNRLFEGIRDTAFWLKLLSYPIAWVLLAYFFGCKRSAILLAVPLLASLYTVALFAYLGWTLSLFAMFGLLLVMAIGTDYAIYMMSPKIQIFDKVSGIVLAMLTTLISFGILGFSQTPAIAMFGRAVAVGVCLSFILVMLFLKGERNERNL